MTKLQAAQQRYRDALRQDRASNEGGDGCYARSDSAFAAVMAAADEAFAAEWTREVFDVRRADFNARVRACGAQLTVTQLQAIEQGLGFTRDELARAKRLLRVD